eukprot:scaffold11_cov257-Pinguiococcus_pyrenoidosus.AAC.19
MSSGSSRARNLEQHFLSSWKSAVLTFLSLLSSFQDSITSAFIPARPNSSRRPSSPLTSPLSCPWTLQWSGRCSSACPALPSPSATIHQLTRRRRGTTLPACAQSRLQ